MMHYTIPADLSDLEPWPFTAPESGYVVTSGTPQASGRMDAGGVGHPTRRGIWRCTTGVFECTEQGDELMTVLAGRCRITDLVTGDVLELGPGSTAFLKDGSRVRWEILEDVVKVFFAYKRGGY